MAQVLRNSGPRRMVPLLAAMVVASLAAGGLAPPEPAAQTASSDGRIAFVRLDPEGFADIWVMDADGANQTNLTNTLKLLEYRASWAPDGAQLVFVRELAGEIISEQADIFVM